MSTALPTTFAAASRHEPASLIVGPMLRYTDAATATIWVQTDRSGEVTVAAGERRWSTRTFTAHGHHYALIDIALADIPEFKAGDVVEYAVSVDGAQVWPEPSSDLPLSAIQTPDPSAPVRLLWGSCRQTAGSGEADVRRYGLDALRAYAGHVRSGASGVPWPTQLLLIGDQIYADEPCQELRDFVAARRDVSQPPHGELAGFAEYAEAYRLAWSDPVIRWFLSCVPTSMIFDDHDIRDDWNTSAAWRDEMQATDWWQGRIIGGLASYAIYQHLGNLPPVERANDRLGAVLLDPGRSGEDLGPDLDKLVADIDGHPGSYRWSYARRFGPVHVTVVDSRAARVLDPGKRDLLNDDTWSWLGAELGGRADDTAHVVLCSSLPVLLPPSLHYGEQWSEVVAQGAWGRRLTRVGERLRQAFDLEHWPAFRRSFGRLFGLVGAVARGELGPPPATVQLLSGDVHFSYLMRAQLRGRAQRGVTSKLYQVVCSPIRNPLPASFRWITIAAGWRWHTPIAWLVARFAGVRRPALQWRRQRGLWFDNAIALSEFDGRSSRVRWLTPTGPDSARTLGVAELT